MSLHIDLMLQIGLSRRWRDWIPFAAITAAIQDAAQFRHRARIQRMYTP
jgi:hypothetical protein